CFRFESIPKAAGSHDEFGVEPVGVGIEEDACRTVRAAAVVGRCVPFDDGDVLTARGQGIGGCGTRQPCSDDDVVGQSSPPAESVMAIRLIVTCFPMSLMVRSTEVVFAIIPFRGIG